MLREAGVVDAGGYGLTVIFAGIVAALRGDEPPPLEHHAPARITHPEHHSSTYRFCTNFAVTGRGLEAGRFVRQLEELGDSVLVVGDSATLKVHVHTDDPAAATAVFEGIADVSRLDVADMRAQVAERDRRLTAAEQADQVRTGALAVVSGEGLLALYESMGVHALDGGPTLNPSTYELLARIHEVPAEEVVVLPNSPNVIMAAERAAELSDKNVCVVPTRAQQTGLAAALALDSHRGASANAAAMNEALEHLRTGAVAPPRATTARAASEAARPSGSWRRRSWPGASRRKRSAPCSGRWPTARSWSPASPARARPGGGRDPGAAGRRRRARALRRRPAQLLVAAARRVGPGATVATAPDRPPTGHPWSSWWKVK